MGPMRYAKRRQTGGAVLKVVLAVGLFAACYVGYTAYNFYQEKVAPVVAGVSKFAANLNPYKLTADPRDVEQWLKSSFKIEPPEGYVGGFGLGIEMLGRKHMQLMALIPKGVKAAEIFEGGRSEIRFSPGPHTIFLAVQYNQSDPAEAREVIAKMAGAERSELKEVFIEAGGKQVAVLRGATYSYGAWNTVVFVFLDEGRVFYAAGPQGSFNEQALKGALTELVMTHPANELLYRHPTPEAASAASPDPCGIPGLPGDFDVVVVSVYKGSTPIDYAIDKSGNEVFQEDVVVGATDKPVVLVLMGYDPIVWNVGRTEGARLAGVLAEGYHRQAVIGLPHSTRLTTYSTEDGANACPYFRSEWQNGGDYARVQRRIKELFGRRIGTFLNKRAGGRFTIGDVSGTVSYSPDVTIKSVALSNKEMPGGQRGIDRLVKEQALRLATEEEVAEWVQGAAARLRQPLDKYRRNMDWRLRRGDVYVVLKPIELPPGLAGAHARTFILPVGAAKPGGPQGHCTFLQMDGFQCYGVGCT